MIASNAVTSAYEKTASVRLLLDAIKKSIGGNGGLFFINKKKAAKLFNSARVQFSGVANLPDGFVMSINDPRSNVKRNFSSVTETPQFVKWFGNRKDHPETIHPALLNEDGTPRVFYHGTPTYGFTAFREGEPIFLTSSEEAASTYSGVKGTPDSYHFADVSKMNLNEPAQFMTEHNNDGIVYSVEKVWDSLRQTNTDKIVANGDKIHRERRRGDGRGIPVSVRRRRS